MSFLIDVLRCRRGDPGYHYWVDRDDDKRLKLKKFKRDCLDMGIPEVGANSHKRAGLSLFTSPTVYAATCERPLRLRQARV